MKNDKKKKKKKMRTRCKSGSLLHKGQTKYLVSKHLEAEVNMGYIN